jgi:DNA-binding MarR family transcriptional regulator
MNRRLTLTAFANRLQELLPRLMQELVLRERNYVTRGVITIPQLWVLDYLREHQHCHMTDLADRMQRPMSTVTGMVDRLVKLRLVRRGRDRKDRRIVHAAITPKGLRVLRDLRDDRRRGITKLFRPLSRRDQVRYLEIIEKLVSRLTPARAGDGKTK